MAEASHQHEPPLAGRVGLVTGAGGDIGRAVAVRFAQAAMIVVLADLDADSEGLELTRSACLAAEPASELHTLGFDVTDDAAVADAVAAISERAGVPPAVVCNNAGYQGAFTNVLDADLADFERVMAINTTGVFSVLRHTARAMVAAGIGGSIVNTASMAGVGGAPNMGAYSTSKSAVIGLTKSAAKDLAPSGIRVNAISPAFIGPGMMWDRQVQLQAEAPSIYYADSVAEVEQQMIGQVPLRRYGSLDEVAAGVMFLASPESSYITGFNLEISGGAS